MAIIIHSRYCERVGLLVALCAVVPGAWATQQNVEGSKTHHQTIHESEAIAPWLVNSDQGLAILGAALESRKPVDSHADCSSFVHEIYDRAGFAYSYANSTELYRGTKEFRRVLHPQPGDLVVWRGHVGIVISPVQHSFFSAMRSGRGVEFYDSPYWQGRGRPRFFRYLKSASRNQFSAATRKASLKSSSSGKVESLDPVSANQDLAPVAGVSGAPPVPDTSKPGHNEDESASATLRADAITSAAVNTANSPPPLSTATRHKIQSDGDGVWEKPTTKPSAEIPFNSVAMQTQQSSPPPQGPRPPSITAMAVPKVAKRPSAVIPSANQSRSEPPLMAMNRYVPRPPWSFNTATTSRPSVPRPPAKRVLRASPGYALPAWPVR